MTLDFRFFRNKADSSKLMPTVSTGNAIEKLDVWIGQALESPFIQVSLPSEADTTVVGAMVLKPSSRANLPQSVLKRHEDNMRFSAEYERLYGDPIDNLITLLSDLSFDDYDD
jgi:hypothetical protein